MIVLDAAEIATWRGRPQRSYALLVGIDTYGPGLPDTPGLAAQAAAIARALMARGVPPGHIHLLTSAVSQVDVPEGVVTGEVTLSSLRKHVRALIEEGSDFLWVHWAGHGYFKANQHHLLLADAEDEILSNITRADLQESFRRESPPARQYWTLDSCQLHHPNIIDADKLHVGQAAASNIKQLVLISSRPGQAASFRHADGTSALGRAVIALLREHLDDDGAPWPPSPDQFEGRIPRLVKEMSPYQVTGQFLIEAPWASYEHPDFRPRRQPLAVRTPLIGWALLEPWSPGTLNLTCSSASMIRLDLRWVVDRQSASIVVVEPPRADLAEDLNVAEAEVDAALTSLAIVGVERRGRSWFTIDASEPCDLAGLPEVPDGTHDPAFVVRVDVGVATVTQKREACAAVDAWVRRIDDRFPTASVIVGVRSELTVDALMVADSLVRGTALRRRSHRDVPAWSAFTRARPGAVYQDADDTGLDFSPADALSGLLSRLAAAVHSRDLSLPTALIPSPAAAVAVEAPLNASEVARLVVEELEESAYEADFDEALLCAVRDFLPRLFHPLLLRYARARHGPGWGVCLAVAAQFDADIQAWMDAAEAAGRRPDQREHWPPPRFGTRPADAAVLHLTRRAGRDADNEQLDKLIEPWRCLGTSPQVDAAVEVFRAFRTTPPPLTDLPIGTVSALAWAALYPSLRGEHADWGADATWVALAHSAAEGTTLQADLTALARTDEKELALAALGLVPLPLPYEPLVHERAAELQRILNAHAEVTLR